MLDRSERGTATKLRTRARPGHAHTLWYVIFNSPENCSDAACGDGDILHRPEQPLRRFNAPQIAATRTSRPDRPQRVAATVLCGELLLGSALVAEDRVQAHGLFGRDRP